MTTFQKRVHEWMIKCMGTKVALSTNERNFRFLEEAAELVQAGGMSRRQALETINYVFSREIGTVPSETGGVMVTLAALCTAHGVDMDLEGWREIDRIDNPEMIEKIRAKHARKAEIGLTSGEKAKGESS